MNGNRKWLFSVIGGLLVLFLSYTVHKIYVKDPECYATKVMVKEQKDDIYRDIGGMKEQINQIHGYLIGDDDDPY